MIELNDLKNELGEIRNKKFPYFSKITLSVDAVLVLRNLFLNPDCISVSDLGKFYGKDKVMLSDIAQEILTPAPQTLASYCAKYKIFDLNAVDLLHCFSLEHIEDIRKNKIPKLYSPIYALSHTLLVGKIKSIKELDQVQIAEVIFQYKNKKMIFKNLIIPDNLSLKNDDLVYFHFGIVIDKVTNLDNFNKIKNLQLQHPEFVKWLKVLEPLTIVDCQEQINFKENLFEKNFQGPIRKNYYQKQKISLAKKIKIKNNLEKITSHQAVIFTK